MKVWNLTLASLLLVISVCLPKAEAKSLSEDEINQTQSILSVSANNNQLTQKQSTLIALNKEYQGPDGDFTIWMPGKLQDNKRRLLMSWSNTTQTVYMIVHENLPIEAPYPPIKTSRVLQTSMRKTLVKKGKIVRSRNISYLGYQGLELLVQHADGKTAQYQAYIVKGRIYLLGSVTEGELTTEAVHFFESFRVYPQRLR